MSDQEEIDWKYPHLARFKNYAIGFGAALILVGGIIGSIVYFMPPLAPQTEPTITIEPIVPAVTQKSKAAAKLSSRPADAAAPVVKESLTTEKPQIDDGFTTELDKQVLNLESKL